MKRLLIAVAGALALGVPVLAQAAPASAGLFDGGFIGAPATANPLPHPVPAQNPFLAPNGTNSMHDDAYGSNGYEVSGPLGNDLQMKTHSYGVSECATMAFDSRHNIVGLCGGLEGFRLRLINPTTLGQIATMETSARQLFPLSNPFTDLCGGTYFYLDGADHAFLLTTTKQIWEVQVTATGFKKLRAYDISAEVPGDDCAIATMPDWSGRIFFATQQGRVGIVDPTTGAVKTTQFAGEGIFNSMSGDESGAIYIVTTHRLAAVAADATGAPVVRWSTTYDSGSVTKPGQLSQGSGTTPTLIGDDVVAITDNADPRMHVQFYSRSGPTAGQLICQAPVFADGASDTENSLVAADGTSVIVENNYGYKGVQTTLLGKTSSPGVAKVVLNGDGTCGVAWTSPVTAPSSVPKVSWANGLVYVYAKPKSNIFDDSWYFTALDVRTGQTVWQQRTGNGIIYNNHYASIYLGPDGAAYMPTLAGLIQLKDGG